MRSATAALLIALAASAAAAETKEAAACRAGFTPDRMLKEIRAELGSGKWKARLDLFAPHLARHYQCRSHVDGRSRCGRLEKFHEPDKGLSAMAAGVCEVNVVKDRFFAAAVRKAPDARERCRAFLEVGSQTFVPRSRGRVCDLFLEHWGDSKKACAALSAPGLALPDKQEKWETYCLETLAAFFAEDAYCLGRKGFVMNNECESPEECNDKMECTDNGAFRKAAKAGDPALCGSSGLCRFFMTADAASCDVYAQQLEDWYCGRFTMPARTDEKALGDRYFQHH